MLQDILSNENVSKLLKEVVNNNRYNNKDATSSLNYQEFTNKEEALFLTMEALYKYKVIIDEKDLLNDYVYQLNLLIRQIDNFHDIKSGINRLIIKLCAEKLGYKDKVDKKKKEIIKYIYDKYITNGYLFHAINDVYKDDIKNNGLIPQQYKNLYNEFMDIKNILGNDFIDKEFLSKNIFFTDSFIMAYYYALNSPIYFYQLLCDNKIITNEEDKKAYVENNYELCNKNINKIINKLELNEKESSKIRKVFEDEWNLINKSNSCPTIIRVKRKLFLKDEKIDNNLINNNELELNEIVDRILDNKCEDIECNFKIESKDIEFIDLPKYNDLLEVKQEENKIEQKEDSTYNNDFGKVSILIVLGSILITLGVIITMVMIVTGG